MMSALMPRSLRAQFAVALSAMGAMVVVGGATSVYALHATSNAEREFSQQRLALLQSAQDLQRHTHQIQRLADRMIAMDIAMPALDGVQALARIRGIASLRNVPVLAVSATVDAAALRLDPGDDTIIYLPKPLDRERLLREIASRLGLRWIAGGTPVEVLATRTAS